MCGLAGFIDFSKRSSPDDLRAMADSLVHRGPDDAGYEVLAHANATIGLGFRRLSIIDLSPGGHQPMHNPDTGVWIVFNGEMYNYREIRDELIASGYSFKSQSDTEVILKAYQKWGISCINRFIGMFAICLFDPLKNKIFFIRDRAGVKPMFYFRKDGLVLFSSELKAFHKHPRFTKEIDTDALSLFFQQGYIPAPYCIFRNCHKIMPGHMLEIDLQSGDIKNLKYWDILDAFNKPKKKISYAEALEGTEAVLSSASRYRMIADVPVGVFLSGGYDSSCVTALLQKDSSRKIKTFTIGFEDSRYNEAPHAKEVADFLGTEHEEYLCTFKEAMDLVPMIPQICDEPFGDPSIVPTTLVSKIARRHVTVALSADAGDELFAGYPRHRKSLGYINKFDSIPSVLSKSLSRLVPVNSGTMVSENDRRDKLRLTLGSSDVIKKFESINQIYTFRETQKLIKSGLSPLHTVFDEADKFSSDNDTLNRILATEYKTYLVDDILQKVDRASMAFSLEAREPFVDHRIAEYMAGIPSRYKMDEKRQKILLKDIVHKYIPEKIMSRPKMGFGVPLQDWMKNDLRDLLLETLGPASLKDSPYLQKPVVEHLLNTFLDDKLEQFERLWLVFVFQQWYKEWM